MVMLSLAAGSADVRLSMSRAESLLRRCYGQLINVAGMYYYVSIPFVILFVLAIAGSIIYAFLFVGYIPIKLMIILGIGAVITVYKMVGSLFVPANSDEPGRSLSRREAPGLWQLTRDVADKLGTKPIDDIRVTPGTELAVYERGSRSDRRNGRGRRALVLGLGLIPDFDQNPFCAVLAHEYGHLAHRDTAGGDVAMRVNRNMMNFAYAMAEAGQAVWWNIGFQFLRLYHFLFLRISHGATRLQEVLADRTAARLYGAQPFEEGLRHVVRRQIEFKTCTKEELQRSIAAGKPFENLYTLETVPDKWLEEEVHGALNRQTSEDDTHPSPKDRFRLASRVICQNHSAAPSGPMWNLFADREAITLEMSSQMEMLTKASAALAIAAFRTRAPISQ